MIPYETIEKILDAARIEDVVGDFVTLKKRGANYTACCPFHNEKTASFSVSPSKGIYKCFGCGKSGTAVGFVMEHESLTYVEALKYLAKKYHIEVVEKEESAEEIARKQRHESLLLVSEYAGKYFRDSLQTQEGQAVGYQYFRSRGLEDATIQKFGLGWAPTGRNNLSEAARAAGYKEEFLIETGLSIKYDDGHLVDRFYDRVVFPIHSVSGRIIGFGCRTLRSDKSVAKYMNSPTSEIYDKTHSLYGIYFAKTEISRSDMCILVEGYLDVISMHQLGIKNVVASSGTSLTIGQIRLIRKFTNNITIIYDGDSAGIKAALRGVGLVLKEGLNVKVVLLPEGQDPDDFARRNSLEQVQKHIADQSQDFISFMTDMLLGEAGGDPLKKASLINEVADTIALIPDAVIRAVYVRTCAEKFEIDESILAERVNNSRNAMLIADQQQKRRDKEREERQNARSNAAAQPVVAPQADMDYMPMPDYDYPADIPSPVDYMPVMPEPPVIETGVVMNEPSLAPCEKEILGFIIEHGCTELEFDRDSKYYAGGEIMNVAEFIDGILADDEAEFANLPYRKVYDEYFRMYDDGLSQEQIQTRLLNSMDEVVREVARDLLIEKHQITVKNYEDSLTAVTTRLVQFVPRSLLVYQSRKVDLILKDLMTELAAESDETRQVELLTKISDFNKARTRLNNELGRV